MAKAFQVAAVGPPQAARDAKSCSVGPTSREIWEIFGAAAGIIP